MSDHDNDGGQQGSAFEKSKAHWQEEGAGDEKRKSYKININKSRRQNGRYSCKRARKRFKNNLYDNL
jgi:hypothetical protein